MKRNGKITAGTVCVLFCVAAAGVVLAAGQSSTNYAIPNDVMSGGGNHSESTNYWNDGTLGQPSPLGGATSPGYENYPGFWQADYCLDDPDYDLLGNCYEDYYGLDPTNPDWDGDGLLDGEEIIEGTDPKDGDSDDDGLQDGPEVFTHFTDPLDPDTDDDLMPDGYEVQETLEATTTDPLTADFDGDGNPNVHEYFNGTHAGDLLNPDAYCGAGGFCFGDSGGFPTTGYLDGPDITQARYQIRGVASDYTSIIPNNGDSADLNGTGLIDGPDLTLYRNLLSGTWSGPLTGAAVSMYNTMPPGSSIVGGATIEFEVVDDLNPAENPRSGYGVVFWIDSTTFTKGRIYGGDGAPRMIDGFTSSLEARYDVTGSMASGGKARVYLHVLEAGTIRVNVKIPLNTEGSLKFLSAVPPDPDKTQLDFSASLP